VRTAIPELEEQQGLGLRYMIASLPWNISCPIAFIATQDACNRIDIGSNLLMLDNVAVR
jgi:hypothetical protein